MLRKSRNILRKFLGARHFLRLRYHLKKKDWNLSLNVYALTIYKHYLLGPWGFDSIITTKLSLK